MEFNLQNLLINIVNMSLTGTYVILFVLLIRFPLKRLPKIFSYSLWSVVIFRLVCPYSFSSAFSLLGSFSFSSNKTNHIPINIGLTEQTTIGGSINGVNNIMNNSLPAATPYASANPMQIILSIASVIWIIGLLLMVIYSITSYIVLKKKIYSAILVYDNVFECENIKSPFVLGILKPKIYLPIGLNENEKTYILKHEQTHIKRLDHLVKPFAFLVLCIHWFNPFVWVSFILMSRDMEMSCDEKVIKELGNKIKREYSTSLLTMAVNRRFVSGSPLAFGESNVKSRIKNVLNYKKPSFWVAIAVAILIIVIGIGLISNPQIKKPESVLKSESYLNNRTEYIGDASKETSFSVEESLKVILSSPLSSSNPADYISAHKKEYANIIKYGGTDALDYMLQEFKNGKAKNDLRGQIMMRLCKELLGPKNNVTDESLPPIEWYSKLDIKEQTILPDFSYQGNDPILKLVYKTEIEKNQNMKYNGGFLIVAPHVHGSYEEGNELKVFVTTYASAYNLYGKLVTEGSGGIVPSAITYLKHSDGSYSLKKYEQAQDGSYFAPSIKKFCTMPVSGKKLKD